MVVVVLPPPPGVVVVAVVVVMVVVVDVGVVVGLSREPVEVTCGHSMTTPSSYLI